MTPAGPRSSRAMDREEQGRRRKLKEIEELGFRPWPNRFATTHAVASVLSQFDGASAEALESMPETDRTVRVGGRVTALRSFGRAAFLQLLDGGTAIQVHIRKDILPRPQFLATRRLDLGDWIGIEGSLFRTRTDELTIKATSFTFLAKAFLPLPEKWHGLSDRDTRYRKRYLDLLSNPATREVFRRRAAIVTSMRRSLDDAGFLEVETPMLQPLATGAAARPFSTHHRALGIELFLRVAPELYLKRLVVGGFPRVYEINRNFRNEGLSTRHNPEFTMLECYRAFSDCGDMMELTEAILRAAAATVLGGEAADFDGARIAFHEPFVRRSLIEITGEALASRGILLEPAALRRRAPLVEAHRALDLVPPPAATAGKLLLGLFEALVERTLIQPTFVTGYPVEVSPLSKADPDDPALTERFELFAGGLEIANGFSELNDPDEQAARFGEQMARRQAGDEHAMDWDYIEALRHGLPPTGGVGVGIDRVAMLFTGSKAIRDVILFPHLRPRESR